jgi:hypothetical protein
MSARVVPGHHYDGDRFFLVSGVLAQAAAEWASQLTVTSAGPVPLYSSCTAASWALWREDSAGKMPRAGQGRPAVRFCRPSS